MNGEKMKVVYDNKEIEVEVVGSYGTFDNPVVEINGDEYVTYPCYVDPETGEKISEMCQSHGCDYCEGDSYNSCRYGSYSDYPVKWFV